MTGLTSDELRRILKGHPPFTFESLKEELNIRGIEFSDDELLARLRKLQPEQALGLRLSPDTSFYKFLTQPSQVWWVYPILAISIGEIGLVLAAPPSSILGPLRAIFGLGLLGFLPGYMTLRAIMPFSKLPLLEQLLLSVFLSLSSSISVGIILGLGQFLQPGSSTIILGGYVVASTLVAVYRKFSVARKSIV